MLTIDIEISCISRENRAVLRHETQDMSMSMDMIVRQEKRVADIVPIKQLVPSLPSSGNNQSAMNGPVETRTSRCIELISHSHTSAFRFEVELAKEKDDVTIILAQLLADTLSHKYPPCVPPPYSEENFDPKETNRLVLEKNEKTFLGSMNVDQMEGNCAVNHSSIISCKIVETTVEILGESVDEEMYLLLHSITTMSESFHQKLTESGIANLRIQENAKSDENLSSTTSQISYTTGNDSGSITAIVTMVPVAVVLLVMIALALRRKYNSNLYYSNPVEPPLPNEFPDWLDISLDEGGHYNKGEGHIGTRSSSSTTIPKTAAFI